MFLTRKVKAWPCNRNLVMSLKTGSKKGMVVTLWGFDESRCTVGSKKDTRKQCTGEKKLKPVGRKPTGEKKWKLLGRKRMQCSGEKRDTRAMGAPNDLFPGLSQEREGVPDWDCHHISGENNQKKDNDDDDERERKMGGRSHRGRPVLTTYRWWWWW